MPLTFRAPPRTKTFSSTYVSLQKLSDIRTLSGSLRQSLGRFAGARIPAARQYVTVNEINDLRTRSKTKWHWAWTPAPHLRRGFLSFSPINGACPTSVRVDFDHEIRDLLAAVHQHLVSRPDGNVH